MDCLPTDMDLTNRDPNNINDHLKVNIEDVIAEVDGTHTINCVWRGTFFCYKCCKDCTYNLITFFCGIFIAIYWGCEFALISFSHVWCVTPCLRCCMMQCNLCQKTFGTCVNCFLAPICEVCSLCFSRIHVTNST